jgi:hypothetical protein
MAGEFDCGLAIVSELHDSIRGALCIPSSRRCLLSLQTPCILYQRFRALQNGKNRMYLHDSSVALQDSLLAEDGWEGVVLPAPLASNTCPDLSDPSGRVKETISLYRGNLT